MLPELEQEIKGIRRKGFKMILDVLVKDECENYIYRLQPHVDTEQEFGKIQ